MWFPEALWEIIKSYQLNYQISWHKKIKNIIKDIPIPDSPKNGPRIVFYNLDEKFRFVKYLYHIPMFKNSIYAKNKYDTYTIIVYAPYFHQYGVSMGLNDKIIIDEYWSYINKVTPSY